MLISWVQWHQLQRRSSKKFMAFLYIERKIPIVELHITAINDRLNAGKKNLNFDSRVCRLCGVWCVVYVCIHLHAMWIRICVGR